MAETELQRWSKEDADAVDKLVKRMARAAGKTKPTLMARAAYMLLQMAAMTAEPDAYVEWLDSTEAGG